MSLSKARQAIPQDILKILSGATIEGNVVVLNSGQLDRKMYKAVDKVLKTLGGKWHTGKGGHLFVSDPTEILDDAILTGSYLSLSNLGYFPTPQPIIDMMLYIADVKEGMRILEPSAGHGAIVQNLLDLELNLSIEAVEINLALADKIPTGVHDQNTVTVHVMDFLEFALSGRTTHRYDRVIMNPPFAKQQDVIHVRDAFQMVKPGGRLVSIMSTGFTFRDNRNSAMFRQLVEDHGHYELLPDKTFHDAGTDISTVMVVLERKA